VKTRENEGGGSHRESQDSERICQESPRVPVIVLTRLRRTSLNHKQLQAPNILYFSANTSAEIFVISWSTSIDTTPNTIPGPPFLVKSLLNMTAEQPSQEPNTASTGKATSLLTKCHCGRIQIQIPKPTKLNECHCTVCYKYGALWAYYNHDEVTIKIADDTTLTEYVRDDSDGNLSFNRCGHCGCMVS